MSGTKLDKYAELDRLRTRLAVLEKVWEKAKDWAAGQPEDRDDVYTGDFPLVELIDAAREELECE